MDLLVLLTLSFKVTINVAFVSDLTRFPLQVKNSWQMRAGCVGTFTCAEHVIYTYVKAKNMQLRASAYIPLYMQHFQVQGEREQTIVCLKNNFAEYFHPL